MNQHINIHVSIVHKNISYIISYLCKCMYTWHSFHILVGVCWIMFPESPTILSNTSTERTLCIGYGIIPPQKKTCKTPGSVQCPIAINYLDWKNRFVITATAFTTVQSNKLKNKSIGFNQLGVSCEKNHSHPSSAIIPLGSLLAKLVSATSNERKAQLLTGHWNLSWKWAVSLQCTLNTSMMQKNTSKKNTQPCGINSNTIQQWPFQAPNKEKRTENTQTHTHTWFISLLLPDYLFNPSICFSHFKKKSKENHGLNLQHVGSGPSVHACDRWWSNQCRLPVQCPGKTRLWLKLFTVGNMWRSTYYRWSSWERFNPSKKRSVNVKLKFFPNRGEHKKYWKPQPSYRWIFFK